MARYYSDQKRRPKKPNAIERAGTEYDELVSPLAGQMQEALMGLSGQIPLGRGFQSRVVGNLDRMAASDEMLTLLKAMPAAGALYGAASVGDVIGGDETFANRGMDLLGMGGGMYGINRGMNGLGGTTRAGQALSYMAAMGLGKMGSDAAQGVIGG